MCRIWNSERRASGLSVFELCVPSSVLGVVFGLNINVVDEKSRCGLMYRLYHYKKEPKSKRKRRSRKRKTSGRKSQRSTCTSSARPRPQPAPPRLGDSTACAHARARKDTLIPFQPVLARPPHAASSSLPIPAGKSTTKSKAKMLYKAIAMLALFGSAQAGGGTDMAGIFKVMGDSNGDKAVTPKEASNSAKANGAPAVAIKNVCVSTTMMSSPPRRCLRAARLPACP
jgi:hypothetical protein